MSLFWREEANRQYPNEAEFCEMVGGSRTAPHDGTGHEDDSAGGNGTKADFPIKYRKCIADLETEQINPAFLLPFVDKFSEIL